MEIKVSILGSRIPDLASEEAKQGEGSIWALFKALALGATTPRWKNWTETENKPEKTTKKMWIEKIVYWLLDRLKQEGKKKMFPLMWLIVGKDILKQDIIFYTSQVTGPNPNFNRKNVAMIECTRMNI